MGKNPDGRRLIGSNQFLPQAVIQKNFPKKLGVTLACSRDGIGIEWQTNTESRAAAMFTPRFDLAAVMVDNEISSHEMDAVFHWTVVTYYEWIEYQTESLLRQSRAVITHID